MFHALKVLIYCMVILPFLAVFSVLVAMAVLLSGVR